jgi:ADP-dependent NAD(P)H-hydrate dehydratase / NAD(P)H-hydrate epimerase
MDIVTASEIQAMDRATILEFGIPGRVLMENAGRGAVRSFIDVFGDLSGRRIGVAAGRGNNGGDGFVMARYLAQRGLDVTVFLLADRQMVGGDAAANLALLDPLGVPVVEVPGAEAFEAKQGLFQHQHVWIDAIFGTGLNAEVRGFYGQVIDFINASRRPVFAVDIPSGLSADSGQILGRAVRADATATFAYAKVGHLIYPGAAFTGRLFVVDIGIPPRIARRIGAAQHLLTAAEVRETLAPRPADAHKGTCGHLLVIAGGTGKTGAAVMTATAAMRAGTGLVTLGLPASLAPSVGSRLLEVMSAPLAESQPGVLGAAALTAVAHLYSGKACLAIGPGLGTAEATARLVRAVVRGCPAPMVIDADALNILAETPQVLDEVRSPLILTPHPGEMARLLGSTTAAVQADRLTAARTLAIRYGICVVLKGARTVVAAPEGTVWINPGGNSGMASGGMGDVLTGIIAGLAAQGHGPEAAARLGVFLHAAAADRLAQRRGPRGFLAGEVMELLPAVFADLADGRDSFPLPLVEVGI